MNLKVWSSLALLAVIVGAVVFGTAAGASHADPPNPDDPFFENQWGLHQINAEGGWVRGRGAGVTIAILDNGIDRDHPDLEGRIAKGITFRNCGDAGCGNGDWETARTPEEMSSTLSAPYHGTHVAGIAAASTNNGIGVVGVAPRAKLLAVKVLGDFTGMVDDVVRGIYWAVDHKADVINMSLAVVGGQVFSLTGDLQDLQDAVAYAHENGVVVVAGAGNEYGLTCDSPALEEGVICVTAAGDDELPADYANKPLKAGLISVAAPGGSTEDFFYTPPFGFAQCGHWILSTVPAEAGFSLCDPSGTGSYAELLGTSMATPHVAGAAAVLVGQGHSRVDVIKLLTCTARTPRTNLRGTFTPLWGFGIIDVGAAVNASPTTCPGGATVN